MYDFTDELEKQMESRFVKLKKEKAVDNLPVNIWLEADTPDSRTSPPTEESMEGSTEKNSREITWA